METKKSWWQSKTIWGIVVAGIGFALGLFGIEHPELPANADFEAIKGYVEAVKASGGGWEAITSIVLQALGFVYALYGRITAKKEIE